MKGTLQDSGELESNFSMKFMLFALLHVSIAVKIMTFVNMEHYVQSGTVQNKAKFEGENNLCKLDRHVVKFVINVFILVKAVYAMIRTNLD